MTEASHFLRQDGRGAWAWAIGALAFAIVLQFELVINRPINWDEFFHLSEAHAFHQWRLAEVLQVLYARAFFWLPMLSGDPIDQIRVARLVMFGFELFTLLAIYAMGRRFGGQLPAAFAALAYVTGGYVFQHGFSYRADPMAAALLMGSLWILLSSRLDAKAIIGAAFLTGLAALTTVKLVFFAPAFAGIAWLRWREAQRPKEMAWRLAAVGGATLLCTALLIGVTILSLPEVGQSSAVKTMSTSARMMFDEGVFPQWKFGVGAVSVAPLLALILLITPFLLTREGLTRPQRVALAALMLPLASLLIYRNAFPYFYSFILPPVMIPAALAIRFLATRFSYEVLAGTFAANALVVSIATPREVLDTQRDVLAAVDLIFPEPVAYFDYSGMIAAFPKANVFMTGWGMRRYRAGYEESLTQAMGSKVVPLLLVNHAILERNQTGTLPAGVLLPQDERALRGAFIPHWGPVWVAGRRFDRPLAEEGFQVYVPGTYTLEGAPARIDGIVLERGDTIHLARGLHRFERIGGNPATLRWGRHLPRPDHPYGEGDIFRDF